MSDVSKSVENTYPTKTQIDGWKKAHGDIFQIAVEDKKAILRKPKMHDLEIATAAAKVKPMNFNKSIFNNCVLWCDEEIRTDDTLFLAACSSLDEVVQIKQAEVKKL